MKNKLHIYKLAFTSVSFLIFVYSIIQGYDLLGLIMLSLTLLGVFIVFLQALKLLLISWNIVILKHYVRPLFFFSGEIFCEEPLPFYAKVCDHSITGEDCFTRLYGIKMDNDLFSFSYSNKTKALYADCFVNGEKLVKIFSLGEKLKYDPTFKLIIHRIGDNVELSVENTYFYSKDTIKIFYDKNVSCCKIVGPRYYGERNHKKIKFELIKV